MLSDSVINYRKYASGYQISEKYSPKVNSFEDSKTEKNSFKNQRFGFRVPGLRKGPVVANPLFPDFLAFYTKKTNNSNTPSGGFKITNKKPNQRAISVGGKNIRPGFLEPEGAHFPNKSVLISPSVYFKEKEDFKEPYVFPLYRNKHNSGFKLSISPEHSDSENSFNNIRTPKNIAEILKNSRTLRMPMTAMSKVPKGINENYIGRTPGLDYKKNSVSLKGKLN